jgi:RHS repeat-associated protein
MDIPELMQKKLDETLQQVFQASLTGKGQAMSGIDKVNRTYDLLASMSKKMEENIQKVTTPSNQALSGQTIPGMINNTHDVIKNMREGLEEMKREEQGPVTLHYYLCNHLGIPVALIDQQGNIVWAVKLDPWGNIEEQFNPQDIDQAIRLSGQYHDRETGLYYNIDRYYDPLIGACINQNPAEATQVNRYGYPLNLATETSCFEFLDFPILSRDISSGIIESKQIASLDLFKFIRNLYGIDGIGTARRLSVPSGCTKGVACK